MKQTMPQGQYEIIVVDDASTDDSREVINSFGSLITPVFLPKNVGVAEASNVGIRKAVGRYVIRVDADDYINENTILFLTELMEQNPDLGFVYTDHLRVDNEERVMERVDINTLDLLFRHGAGIIFRKTYLESIGLYNPKLRNAEDYDLLKRYITNFNGYHLRLPLYRYRQHDTNMTNDEVARKKWEQHADAHRK
jgi:glycosyltransferase involved in cell wall biosynthesis